MPLTGFGPMHFLETCMVVELTPPDPDTERLDELFGKTMVRGLIQTVRVWASSSP